MSCVCRKSREGKNIADLATLTQLGKEIGLDETELQTAFSDDSYAYRVTQDIAEGRHIGVQGVPFFVLDRKYGISGAQPPAVFLENLEGAFKEWRELNPESKLKMASNGPSCTPDGIC
ncbi:DsbA family oxidoreductase [Flavobacterium psychraquaticum]|uniref:DsbA family oxidoreductase n=1 Tax=Flavobacterium psychraquaticum TaxID=3103958 RepID=UPI002ACF006E|nr:DsbA family protein [Flavobacterium sp. LB-N7T]